MTIDVGEIVRTRREEQGLSQMALAQISGVSRGTIDAIESGRTKSPSVAVTQMLFTALSMKLDVVIEE